VIAAFLALFALAPSLASASPASVDPGVRVAQVREDPPVVEAPSRTTLDPRLLQQLQVARIIVPDFRGMTVQEAWEAAAKAGLARGEINRIEADTRREEVVRHSPGAGAEVPRGTPLNLYVHVPGGVRVPNVVGMEEPQAWKTIEGARLARGERFERPAEAPPGTVVAQQPAGNTRADPGSPVALTFAVPAGIEMPRLIGLKKGVAWEVVKEHGLRRGDVEKRPSNEEPGTVLDQAPGPGRTVERGMPVSLVVAGAIRIEVPDLQGLSEAEALARVEKARLVPGAVRGEVSDARIGTVVRQDPAAGATAQPGERVRIWLAEPRPLRVPELIGLNESRAWAAVEKSGLTPGQVNEREADETPGTVVDQDPPPGETVRSGQRVDIWLATRSLVEVPQLRGLSTRAAWAAVREAGLRRGEVEKRPAVEEAGTVLEQSPGARERVERGTPVQLWVATRIRIDVPDLVGLPERDAWALVKESNLAPGGSRAELSDEPAGTVVRQDPRAGATAAPGDAVRIWLAEVRPVRVPDLSGMAEARAWAAVEEAGLMRGEAGETGSDAEPGTVARQEPLPRESVQPGSRVRIWLATRTTIAVPDLAGMTEARAGRALGALGLELETIGRESADGEQDTVSRQSPAPGFEVPSGSTVGIWLTDAFLVPVPRLIGLEEGDAWRTVEAAGLARGPRETVAAPQLRGEVVGQSPDAGRMVPKGTPVELSVSGGAGDRPNDGGAPGRDGDPSDGQSGQPWRTLAMVAVLGLVVGGVGREVIRRMFRRPMVRMRPIADSGTAVFDDGPPALAGPSFELRPKVDPGAQRLSPAEFFDARGSDHD
jgi:beta-lactam-binding protein with PASTA domain